MDLKKSSLIPWAGTTNLELSECFKFYTLKSAEVSTVKSGIIVVGINIITSLIAFLAGPILVNMNDVDVLQK